MIVRDFRSAMLTCIAAFAAVTPLSAQPGPPAERTAAFFDALTAGRWRDAAPLIHPERLRSFQREQIAFLLALTGRRALYQRQGMPYPEGDHFAIIRDTGLHADSLAHYSAAPVSGFGPAQTIGAASALMPLEFMTHWLAVREHDPDTVFRRRFGHVPRHVIGAVVEGDSVAHALYRVAHSRPPGELLTDVKILRLRRHAGAWYVWPYLSDFDFWTASLVRLQLAPGAGGRPR